MNLKDYKNMNSFELEKYLAELLKSDLMKKYPKKAEIEKVYQELKKQNFIKLMKESIEKIRNEK